MANELHHIIAKRAGGNPKAEVEANWILICRECHAAFHAGHLPLLAVLRTKYMVDGFLLADVLQVIAGRNLTELEAWGTTGDPD